MLYTLFAMVGLLLGIVIILVTVAVIQGKNNRRKKARKRTTPEKSEITTVLLKNKFKFEFVKIIVFFVLLTYFVGVYIGVKIVFIDYSQLGVLLAFIGTPTAAAIGFYCWKAKAENIIKIKKDNPTETEGIPVDINNIHA